jgi:glycosyltransferase involved in cell wall biosynthesis
MRVALLTSAAGWRGSGASYAKLARGLQERGHTVLLVTAASRLTHRLADEGLQVTQIPGRRSGPLVVWALRHALASIGAEAVVADTPRDVRLSFYATLLHRARIVYRYNFSPRRPRARLLDRMYLSRVSACVYQSKFIHDDALSRARWMRRIASYQVPNGYDTTRYAPRPEAAGAFRERYGIDPGARVVLSAAKLTRNKGQEVAINALHRLHQQGMNVVYVVCGDGHREGELSSMAAGYKLPTVFTGLLGTRDMIAGYNAADVVVHPSLQEIFPNAVGEAMACGRPVVAADAGGTAELVGRDGAAGVLVPPADASALADVVQALLDDPPRLHALGAAARRRIEVEFPVERMVAGYERALAEVIRGGG